MGCGPTAPYALRPLRAYAALQTTDYGLRNTMLLKCEPAEFSYYLMLRGLVGTLFLPGKGQVRFGIPDDARRSWSDFHMWSHLAFVPGIILAATPLNAAPLPELAGLQLATMALSLGYHQNYERPGPLALCEGICAKALFGYGSVQTMLSPSPELLAVNSVCLGITVGTYVTTNVHKGLYDRWHPIGLHIVPGVWSLNVALHHKTLLPPMALQGVHHVTSMIVETVSL